MTYCDVIRRAGNYRETFSPCLSHKLGYKQHISDRRDAQRLSFAGKAFPRFGKKIAENRRFCTCRSSAYGGRFGNLGRYLERPDDSLSSTRERKRCQLPSLMCKTSFKISFFQLKITLLVTAFMTSSSALRIFLHSLIHRPNVYLQYLGSEKAVSCCVSYYYYSHVSSYMPGICL